jgi:hypothetical protein
MINTSLCIYSMFSLFIHLLIHSLLMGT